MNISEGKTMDRKVMMECVYNQLAIDYNCEPDDFLKDGLIFTVARKNEGRRSFPFVTPRLEMISMGHSTIINVSSDILPYIRHEFKGKTWEEVFNSPFIYGVLSYFLPDIGKIAPLTTPDGFELVMVEKQDIQKFYDLYGSQSGMQYDPNSQSPEMLLVFAKYKDAIAGIAKAKADCKTMWSIDVDVMNSFRGKGLAAPMVNMLTLEILNRGYIPYYFTTNSHVLSTHVAVRAGYIPAWVHSYKTRLDGILK
jgi:predicted GNAT family acetyltransferase